MSDVNREERKEEATEEEVTVSKRFSPLDNTDRGLGTIGAWLAYAGVVCLIGLMGMVVFEVVARYLFNKPFQGYIDIMEMMMVALVFLTLAYCQRTGGHIRMEIFMSRVLVGGRRYYVAEFFHLFVSLVGFGIIAYFAVNEIFHAYEIGDVTMTVRLPTWPARITMALGSIVLCLRFILQMSQSARYVVFGGKEPRMKEGVE